MVRALAGKLGHCLVVALGLLFAFLECALAAAEAVPVDVVTVEKQLLTRPIEALGTLRANEAIQITTSVTKKITHIHFKDGQRVAKGALLVEMRSVEEEALLKEAKINAEEAKKQLERVKSLLSSNAASRSLYDQRAREYEAAQARYLAIEARLADLQIVAPFDGMLGLRQVSRGALVTPGDVMTTLVDDTLLKLDFTVPAVNLTYLTAGLQIDARSQAYPAQRFEGKVVSLDNQVDPVTRAITVRALLPNPDGLLKPGMLMRVQVQSDARVALLIPEASLVPLAKHQYVYVVTESEKGAVVEQREVTIGQRLPGKVEILKGVAEGEQIVFRGLLKVRPGKAVKPTLVNAE